MTGQEISALLERQRANLRRIIKHEENKITWM